MALPGGKLVRAIVFIYLRFSPLDLMGAEEVCPHLSPASLQASS